MDTPFDLIRKSVESFLTKEQLQVLPEKWEKIGDVLIIKVPESLSSYKQEISKRYAQVLGCKTVLDDVGGIVGLFREPKVQVLYGSSETETVHKENGIRFKLDPQKVMFSSGNMDERLRMARISNNAECVVDLFAGIGYFSIPMAVYSKPKKIIACEINPVAYNYLEQNVVLNHVSDRVTPVLGDNQIVAPKQVADRVVMGYVHGTHHFLAVALSCLKPQGGVVHFHDVFAVEEIPETPFAVVESCVRRFHKTADLLGYHVVKSFAPSICHVVLDVEVR